MTARKEILISIIRGLAGPLEPIPADCPPRLVRLPNIRAIALDVYGTLFISASGDIGTAEQGGHEKALREALQEGGFQTIDSTLRFSDLLVEAIRSSHQKRRDMGIAFPEVEIRKVWQNLLERLIRERRIEGEANSNTIQTVAVTFECLTNPVWPMPGLDRTIEALKASDILLGIVSNAQFYTPLLFPALLRKSLSDLDIQEKHCVWSYQFAEAKPSSRLFQLLRNTLQESGILPSQTLFLGNDIRNDILPAQRAGFRTALFAGDLRSLKLRKDDLDCLNIEPDLVLTELPQLLQCV